MCYRFLDGFLYGNPYKKPLARDTCFRVTHAFADHKRSEVGRELTIILNNPLYIYTIFDNIPFPYIRVKAILFKDYYH
jgi:hypothetical protein